MVDTERPYPRIWVTAHSSVGQRVALWERDEDHPLNSVGEHEINVSGADIGPSEAARTPAVARALATSGDSGGIPPKLVQLEGAALELAQRVERERRENQAQVRLVALQAEAMKQAELDRIAAAARGELSLAKSVDEGAKSDEEWQRRLSETEEKLRRSEEEMGERITEAVAKAVQAQMEQALVNARNQGVGTVTVALPVPPASAASPAAPAPASPAIPPGQGGPEAGAPRSGRGAAGR